MLYKFKNAINSVKHWSKKGIATGIHYPTPIHLQPACTHYGYIHGMLPVTEAVTARIVSLPMYPELTTEQTTKGCECRQD